MEPGLIASGHPGFGCLLRSIPLNSIAIQLKRLKNPPVSALFAAIALVHHAPSLNGPE